LTNERSEFLITTLPVSPLTTALEDTIYFPHFADGGGWTTQVILVNPTDSAISGTVRFLGPGSSSATAQAVSLILTDAQVGSEFSYSIPPRSSKRLQTSNPDGATQVGSVRVIRDSWSSSPSGVAVFSLINSNVTVSEAGVPAQTAGSIFRVYVEASGTSGAIGSVRSGVAITNTSSTATTATFELTDLTGTSTGQTGSLVVPALGQIAKFVDEIFPSLTTPFSGVLRVTSNSAKVAIVGLRGRTNQRSDFLITTTPPTDEGGVATSTEFLFPHLVDGGGWSTQIVLFSGISGQNANGMMRFFASSGEPVKLTFQ
jgi:hypothetical protein